MVIYGFRKETGDIDLGCCSKLASELEKQGYQTTVLEDGTRRIAYDEDIEIFENWLMDKVVLQDGFPVVSVDGLIAMKKNLGREKDYRDIEMINCMRREMCNVKIEIRRAVGSDYEALAKIGREDMGYAESTAELTKEKLHRALAKDYERVFVAVCDETVAGFVHAEQYDVLYYPTMINILGLAVSGAYPQPTSAFTAPDAGCPTFHIPYFTAIHIHYNFFFSL